MKKTLSVLLLLALTVFATADEAKKKPKWDVSKPPGKGRKVPINVKSGTWMSLDVSKDGKLVFDLLGDLYIQDKIGGPTRHLTSGMEWDMHPKFSPDGRHIAFTSDRGGGDNLWVMSVNGGESSAKAISEEKFRLVTQPTWDPSGDYVAGRKHFTGTRSLGAGEIWAYHVDGKSSGVQLTKRKNDQLDLGEPAFSPDGRYLYYSRDITPGKTFQYNKDPNAGIYAIERLDRQTGKIERVTGGSGGACAPTPSPDGEYLAFVRRIRGKSVLMVRQIDSGAEWPIFDGLDRDMQETWAIHGVYPSMAWTADSKELVFWASGKLWKLERTSASTPQEIAFQVADFREVRESIRLPVEVAPAKFDVKSVRSSSANGSGATVFSALGKIWYKSSQTAQPQRLTLESLDGVETSPSFVNANEVVFALWRGGNLGSLWLKNISTGKRELLVNQGRFTEPALSRDKRYLVYRKLGKSSLFPPEFIQSPGLYVKDLSSPNKPPRLLDSGGREPHFGIAKNVVFYRKGGEKTALVRRELDTGANRVLFDGKDITGMWLSPDEKHLAFTEAFQLYVSPVTLTGRTVAVGAKSKALPTKKVSGPEGAYFPSWSRDGKICWSVGPKHYKARPDGTGKTEHDLSWKEPLFRPDNSSVLALVGGKVITMKGDEIFSNGTVVVRGDRIENVGQSGLVEIPSGAKVIDCTGKTVMPGLVDVHWHGSFSDGETFPQVNWVGLSSLSFGLTTLHDPSNDTASVFTAKEMQLAGKLVAPRIFSTGTILYGAKAAGYYAPIDSLDDALGHLKRMQAWGARSVKSYNQPRRDQRQQVLEGARQIGMMVVPEGGSLFQHNLSMVVDGHTGIEHALPVAKLYDDVVALWSGTKVGYTPTLGVAYGGIWGENFWYVKTDVWDDARLNQFVPREVIDPAARRRMSVPDEEYNHRNASAGANKLAKSGVKVNLGAHGQREGLAVHWELWMLEQGGMTPHQALRCGTLNGAHYLGMDKDIGSLEQGKLADIIVLDKDPLVDIKNSKHVAYTIQGGRVFESATMKEIYPNPGPEPKVWWR